MKNNIITIAISAFAVAFALASCDEPFEYTPAPVEDSTKTLVGADVNAVRHFEAAGEDILVPFVRNNKSGALEVSLFLEDTTGIFTLATPTITFADGDSLATAKVSYDYADLVMDVTYSFTVGVADKELISDFLPSTFPVSCIKAWENLGIAQFYDDWWTGGPFEKTLLKSPDGSETYRLITPWTEEEITEGGFDFTREVPYLEFFIDDEGIVTYAQVLDMGFTFSGMTCHMLHPTLRKDDASAAQNCVVAPNVIQFCWYPVLDYGPDGFKWWGKTSVAYISFPGGPDLAELLGL